MMSEELRLIELALSEIELPEDADLLREGPLDRGVVLAAMVDYLKLGTHLPISPRVTWVQPWFRVIDGAKTLWAARKSGWTRSFQAVLAIDRRATPEAIWERTTSFPPLSTVDGGSDFEERIQVLHFMRSLERSEKIFTEDRLAQLAEAVRANEVVRFSEISNLAWITDAALAWSTPVTLNTEDCGGAVEWFEFLADLRRHALPLLAVNGRKC
ncbi:hypothetical protein [Paraburkholderia sp. MM5477-R1]|uniref:hypothetical protein n=1 Tax=Paraburkholderia sp. MM5477-R1 TaxID=2991062 RepID=UPI003D1BF38D